jgi:hypothetical protein
MNHYSKETAMEEYLYVDDERLDKCLQEFGSPLSVQKERQKSVEISWTPKVTFSESEKLVPPTRSEKIEYLLENLRERDLLTETPFRGLEVFGDRAKGFHLETCDAVKTLIDAALPEALIPSDSELSAEVDEIFGIDLIEKNPQNFERRKTQFLKKQKEAALARAREQIGDFKGLNIWISDRRQSGPSTAERRGQLFLIVGFPNKDYAGAFFERWSAHSAFTGLLNELGPYFAKSILHNVADESDNPTSEFQNAFLADPFKTLRSFGARVGDSRRIKTLYRVRSAILYKELGDDIGSIATIAYPIFIADAQF